MSFVIDRSKMATILLAYADFESLEIALAAYSKFLNDQQKLFILQNGRETYDCERTYRVAKRYEALFPENIKVVDWIEPGPPYLSIKTLLNSSLMDDYDYICKVDDDAFPLRGDWYNKLIKCYEDSYEKFGDDLAYVTSLVNNNPWGFNEILDIMNLKEEYMKKIAKKHVVGIKSDDLEPERIAPANEIYTGWCGTVWRNPYISRWLHKNTTFFPEKIIKATEHLGYKEVESKHRYSINCMLFKKEFWFDIDDKGTDDELMCVKYCRKYNKKIVSDLSNPFVHLFFFSQREENKDLLPEIRNVYEKYLQLPYPIAICPLKEYENENRLRFIENQYFVKLNSKKIHKYSFLQRIFSIKNDKSGKYKNLVILGLKFKIKRTKHV